MDCSLIATELIAYHFGAVTDAKRADIEGHLVGCTECLRAYLALKGAAERGAHSGRRPSSAAKKRLRDEVEATFASTPPRRRWFRREIPLYQGLAAAAVAAALALLLPRITHVAPTRRPPSGAVVDTSRTSPESLSIY